MYLLYFVLWVIFNGRITLEIVLFGIAIAALIFAFTCKFMDYSIKKEIRLYKKVIGILYYLGTLFSEIVKANLSVLHMIFSEKEELKPVLVRFHTDLKGGLVRVMLADSITLTPGTITVLQDGSDYVVHCLDEDLAVGLDRSVFVQKLTELEKEKPQSGEK